MRLTGGAHAFVRCPDDMAPSGRGPRGSDARDVAHGDDPTLRGRAGTGRVRAKGVSGRAALMRRERQRIFIRSVTKEDTIFQ